MNINCLVALYYLRPLTYEALKGNLTDMDINLSYEKRKHTKQQYSFKAYYDEMQYHLFSIMRVKKKANEY